MSLFDKVVPEKVGVSTSWLNDFLDRIEEANVFMHSCLMMKDGQTIMEAYWDPVEQDELHRLYSATKSFVSIAIGLLSDKGLLSLDDKIVKFFPDLVSPEKTHPYVYDATIKDLLTMSTPFSVSTYDDPDHSSKEWLASYFCTPADHPSGAIYNYDSCGTYVLGSIVKRITGKHFYEYLREEILDEMGFDKESRCILGPDLESWSGSGILLSLRDFAKFGFMLLNKGKWNGKQMVSEEYVAQATTKQVDNNQRGFFNPWTCGYGYKFWITKGGAFRMDGAGSQLALCIPEKNFLFVCNADTQGSSGNETIFAALWDTILNKIGSEVPVENGATYEAFLARCESLKLLSMKGDVTTKTAEAINHKVYTMNENPMHITEMSLHFDGDKGYLEYCNARGRKQIHFGMGEGFTTTFPETHFHGEVLGEPIGREFRTVNSAAWVEESKLQIRCNIIDVYVGNLTMTVSFKGDEIAVYMHKNAQFFLKDYHGYAGGKAVQ